jgi:hypothetical protein
MRITAFQHSTLDLPMAGMRLRTSNTGFLEIMGRELDRHSA